MSHTGMVGTGPGSVLCVVHDMPNDGLYYEAARIIVAVRGAKARLKGLCYNSKQRNKKALMAITSEVLKRNPSRGRLQWVSVKFNFFRLCSVRNGRAEFRVVGGWHKGTSYRPSSQPAIAACVYLCR